MTRLKTIAFRVAPLVALVVSASAGGKWVH
jgi:hypothetical protein